MKRQSVGWLGVLGAVGWLVGWGDLVNLGRALADPPPIAIVGDGQSKMDAIRTIKPLVDAIQSATQLRATVELTSRSMINGQVVASESAVYQIASKTPNLHSIQLKGGDQLLQVVCDGKKSSVVLGGVAYFEVPPPDRLQMLVTELPIPLGPYPEPIMALSLAGVDLAETFINSVPKLEVVDGQPQADIPSVQIRGVQDDGVTWSLWLAADPKSPRPLRMKVDLTTVVVGDNAEGLPAGFAYELDFKFSQWRIDGDLNDKIFVYDPPAESKQYESLQDLIAGMQPAPEQHPLVGMPAPEITTTLVDGTAFKLSQHRGKVVILDFWATWCGPCVEAMPVIADVAASMADSGVVLYAVNVGEKPKEIKEFLERLKMTLPVVMDEDGKAADAYHTEAIPQTVLIGKDGRVEVVHIGFAGLDEFKQDLNEQLKRLVAGESIAAQQAEPDQQ